MELPVVIGIVVIAIVVLGLLLLGLRAVRSRSERTDWLGELSEIRRSSLGDDEEVTGALEAVTISEDDETGEADGLRPSEPVPVIEAPNRTATDSGTLFNEYDWPGLGALRIDATEPRGLRVMVDAVEGPSQVMVDLPRGVLWFRSDGSDARRACSVRTAAGWVLGEGDLLIVVADDDWSYVMCLDGKVTLRFATDGRRSTMTTGQIGRIRAGTGDHDIVDVGTAALESEGVVRRQRRLDEQIGVDHDHR